MTAPLSGIRVLEVASWLAAPSCAALMADMGADVIKVEPTIGDGYRRLYDGMLGEDAIHPSFQFDNRGKRGICVDLESEEGQNLVRELASDVDIFLTNLTQPRLEKYGLTDDGLHKTNPTLIFAALSGYGLTGPDSDRTAFDQTAFWARSGAMSMFGDRDDTSPLLCRGGYGDRTTALNLLSSILAALRLRDQTGEGQYVEVTLQRTGVWTLASDVCNALHDRVQADKSSHKAPPSPIWNYYRTADDRWFAFVMPDPRPYWGKFCKMLGREDWLTDARFQELAGFTEHSAEIIPELDALFASHDLAWWREKFDAAGLIWEPVALLTEVIEDPALRERGAFTLVVHDTAGAVEIVAAPFYIRGAEVEARGPAPNKGQHTKEVLLEKGLSEAEIDRMMGAGVVL